MFSSVAGENALLLRELSSCIQTVEVENRVENQGIAAHRLAAVHRIIGEQNDVSGANRHVNHGRMLGDFLAAFPQPRDEQLSVIGV